MSELLLQGLCKQFGQQRVIDQLDLHIPSGSLLALLGPSGSGKTTLLRMLCGFEHLDAGSISIGGKLASSASIHVPPERRRIGYVPQEGALFPHLSVADNIVFGLPRSLRKRCHRVAELLEMVGLPAHFATRAPQQLSGGQQQRVALARALAPEPAVVLLDEPFSALDTGLRNDTRQAVLQTLKAVGATAVLVTHDQSEALSCGEQVAVLWEGQLLQQDSPANLYCRPRTPELAGFLGESILLPGIAGPQTVECELGSLPLSQVHQQGAVDVLIRPEQIRLGPPSPSQPQARIIGMEYFGHDATLHLELLHSRHTIKARTNGWHAYQNGQTVGVAVDGSVTVFA
ncbi:ABC transporter ATP-binding protein [Aquitalea aquatilis]|uniref:ABC transporter ATP-binding protein n=1 Tax=Aquitalea aquatilis TaxID=1537400 RepID=UPI0010BD5143|nr:ABC transporter ATP-binding protein [Aquitalea aquatilis]